MLPHRIAATVFLCAAAFLATGPARADMVAKLRHPAQQPPAGYDGATWVDSSGCTFFRDSAGRWIGAVETDGTPVCGPKARLGAISPLTGFPVPQGYRVVWTDGRLNPVRGPLSRN